MEDIIISESLITLTTKGETYKIEYSIKPENATNKELKEFQKMLLDHKQAVQEHSW